MDKDYLLVLAAIQEIPFGVGKKLLGDVLCGNKNESIEKNKLNKLDCYGSALLEAEELGNIIDGLITNKLVEQKSVPKNKYWKVLLLTEKGKKELMHPSLNKSMQGAVQQTVISENEKYLFKHFDFFLNKYNDEQKKAIIANSNHIACIAGAGTGKTAVLTKRIEFLCKFRSIAPEKILAITFTRKAKKEMENRLQTPFTQGVVIETFNSFSEKMLQKYNDLVYDKEVSVLSYGEKIKLVGNAVKAQGLSMGQAVNKYFSTVQKKLKSDDELWNIFINDCFAILDCYKNENKNLTDFSKDAFLSADQKIMAEMMYKICSFIDSAMKQIGKRDFADQVVDALKLFEKHPDVIPKFEHILIDEYQDINAVQQHLISLLQSPNVFCVGDPRQSIFGWRGSRINYILDFAKIFPDAEVITLKTNYRSNDHIISLANLTISSLKLPDLESSAKSNRKDLSLLKFDNQEQEIIFLLDQIKNSSTPPHDMFILARTNRTLLELAQHLTKQQIPYIVRSDEIKRPAKDNAKAITLATIHAIKGMEARDVYLIGCNTQNFPCRTSDHPIIDIIKNGNYDKEEEERRLFYVGVSRAKEKLVMTYTGNSSRFITNDMKKHIGASYNKTIVQATSGDALLDLKNWRRALALKNNVPAYTIMNDATLQEIIQQQPMTLDELEQVKGMGPVKIQKYGEEILKLVNGF